ncbi:Isoprenoid synthase domain containing protein [Elaphomyces granulatus]
MPGFKFNPGQVTKQEYEEILTEFFHVAPLPLVIHYRDPSIEETIIKTCLSHGLNRETTIKAAKTGAVTALWMYPLHKKEVQLAIGLFTAFCIEVEDLGDICVEEIRNFRENLLLGRPQLPLLQSCTALPSLFDQYYDRFSSDKITTGLINFMGSCVLEFERTDFGALESSPKFPNYFRLMTGLAEPYTFFLLQKEFSTPDTFKLLIQAAPDIMDFTDHLNDLLSFYKESIVSDDRNNFVYQQAMAQRISVHEVLRNLARQIMGYIDNIKRTMSTNPDLSKFADEYIRGFIGFHMDASRYRLSELDIPELAVKRT